MPLSKPLPVSLWSSGTICDYTFKVPDVASR